MVERTASMETHTTKYVDMNEEQTRASVHVASELDSTTQLVARKDTKSIIGTALFSEFVNKLKKNSERDASSSAPKIPRHRNKYFRQTPQTAATSEASRKVGGVHEL